MGWTFNPFDDHLDNKTTVAEIKEKLSHADLSDMPDTLGTNTDHDVRLLKPHVPTLVVAASDSSKSGGADYTCDGTADDVQINAALAALPSTGGIVKLLDGTYNISAQIVFGKNYSSLHGSGWSTILNSANYSTDHTISLASYTFCEIADLKIIGKAGGGNLKDLIYGDACNDSTIRGCYLTNSDRYGIGIDNAYRLNISNNTITNNDTYGAVVTCDLSVFKGNIIFSNKSIGLYVAQETAAGGNVIEGNIIKGNTSTGLDIRAAFSTVVGNVIGTNGSYGIYCGSSFVTIVGNTIYSSTNDNINMVAGNIFIYANIIAYSSGHNLYASGSNYCSVVGNQFFRAANNKNDIYINASIKVTISNNCIYTESTSYSERAIYLTNVDDSFIFGNHTLNYGAHGTYGMEEDANCSGNIIVGNNFEGETTAYSLSGTGYKKWKAMTPISSQGRFLNIVTTTAAYTVTSIDDVVICNSGTAFTVTLPTAATGQRYHIKNINTGVVTIDGAGGDTIDGSETLNIYKWEDVIITCYAANSWGVI